MGRVRRGVLLAGGNGSRLYPLTKAVNKHLLPIYDKPLIYYPLSTLMLANIKDILIVTSSLARAPFEELLGDGSALGIRISYEIQEQPKGLSDALLSAERFIDGEEFCLALGDNIFFSSGLSGILDRMLGDNSADGAAILTVGVSDPERFGVVEYDDERQLRAIVEKPVVAPSNKAVTGLYRLPKDAVNRAKKLEPSLRGEMEITDLLNTYCCEGQNLNLFEMPRGGVWFDAGTNSSMYAAIEFVQSFQEASGSKIGSPEEVAIQKGWLLLEEFERLSKSSHIESPYLQYLKSVG